MDHADAWCRHPSQPSKKDEARRTPGAPAPNVIWVARRGPGLDTSPATGPRSSGSAAPPAGKPTRNHGFNPDPTGPGAAQRRLERIRQVWWRSAATRFEHRVLGGEPIQDALFGEVEALGQRVERGGVDSG